MRAISAIPGTQIACARAAQLQIGRERRLMQQIDPKAPASFSSLVLEKSVTLGHKNALMRGT